MYGIALYTLTRNYSFFLAIAVALTVIEAVGLEINLGASIVIYGLVAMYSHRMILLDEQYGLWSGPGRDEKGKPIRLPFWAFFWRYGLFFFVYVVASLTIMLLLMPLDRGTETGKWAVILGSVTLAAPVVAVVLALFGTTLPAVAVGDDRSFTAALRRGRQRFGATLLRLIGGPGLVSVLNVVIIIALAQVLSGGAGALVLAFLGFALSFLPTHMVAVALSMAYLETKTPSASA